jgi:hypothetical protein
MAFLSGGRRIVASVTPSGQYVAIQVYAQLEKSVCYSKNQAIQHIRRRNLGYKRRTELPPQVCYHPDLPF